MVSYLMVFHAIISVFLIVLVLIQFGKGAEAGLISSTMENYTGPVKGNFLTKTTIVIIFVFMGNSLLLSKLQSNHASKSILDSEAPIARPLNADAAAKPATSAPAPVAPADANATAVPAAAGPAPTPAKTN